jgi:hypothetical protein
MNSLHRVRALFLLVGALSLPFTGAALAEVGAQVDLNGGVSSYIVSIVIDDPEPVSVPWKRYFDDGGGRVVLNDQGFANGDGPPSLARDVQGLPVAAWAQASPAGFDVVFSRFDGAVWTAPQVVAGTPADERSPALVLHPADGTLHLLYWVADPTPRVLHVQAPPDLSSWSVPVQVSAPGEIACRPSGAFHEGVLHVAFESHPLGLNTTPRQIVLATGTGPTLASEILATTYHAGPNRPQVHASGDRLWVDWIDTACDMAWMRRVSGGAWEGVQAEPFQDAEQREFHVRGLIRTLAVD